MEQPLLLKPLAGLFQRLSLSGHRIGTFAGYMSTTKGVTLISNRRKLFVQHELLYMLLQQPEQVTDQHLAQMMAYNEQEDKWNKQGRKAFMMWAAKSRKNMPTAT